jgi:hypothetical protein
MNPTAQDYEGLFVIGASRSQDLQCEQSLGISVSFFLLLSSFFVK